MLFRSNVGMQTIKRETTLGFRTSGEDDTGYENMRNRVMEELRNSFRPEFLNRVDETIVFHALNKEHIREIVSLMIREVTLRMKELGVEITVADAALDLLAREGFDENYGARPLRRAIQRMLEDMLSEELLKKTIVPGDQVVIEVTNDKIMVNKKTG